jgi:hypothetical protein
VASIITTMVSNYIIGLTRKIIGDFPLTFITPLGTNNDRYFAAI